MAPRKSERIVNLTICLLSARRFLPKEQIREIVEGYNGLSDANFERTFERDKDELRAMGVPVETGHNEAFFDDEPGYRIRRADFEFPPVEFTPAEATALGAAARVWQQASVAEQTVNALAKLRAAGVEPDTDRLAALEPSVTAMEPAFEPIWRATLQRRRVRFTYRGKAPERLLEPWSVTWRKGRWYVIGQDLTRGEPRMFKMGRITGIPVLEGEADSYQVPDVDLAELARRLEPSGPRSTALVAVREGHAPTITRRSERVRTAVALPVGFTVWRVPYASRQDLVGEVCAAGADALVVEPAALREMVLEQLRAVVAAPGEFTQDVA
ncbi:proteasome accessory factor B [Luteococcus japonicus]|uniref:Proteasome accessory factor B n=1 Tax=Luteococcus japonicus TaxID=33984 RepID=A0A3N1ZYE3_9ACTN|nr:WYL domain-containing protein [Luteococcus japonicus]ROR55873.1 proteasome accessory factor B [Luteococcus japonicus]